VKKHAFYVFYLQINVLIIYVKKLQAVYLMLYKRQI